MKEYKIFSLLLAVLFSISLSSCHFASGWFADDIPSSNANQVPFGSESMDTDKLEEKNQAVPDSISSPKDMVNKIAIASPQKKESSEKESGWASILLWIISICSIFIAIISLSKVSKVNERINRHRKEDIDRQKQTKDLLIELQTNSNNSSKQSAHSTSQGDYVS